MNESTTIKYTFKFRVHSKDHGRILEILEGFTTGDFVRSAVLEKIYRYWKIKNLDDEMQDLLMELEEETNPHYSEYGDFFAYFEDEDVENYLHTYEDEFINYFKDNIDLCYDR